MVKSCTCGPNEACSDCPPGVADRSRMVVARRLILDYMVMAAKNKLPADQIRNLATAYGILTDKHLAEHRVTCHTDATGDMVCIDAYGRRIES